MRVGRSRPRKVIATRNRRASGYAWLAALTMTVLAVTPLLAIFHQLSTRHAVCEHGELIESGHGEVGPVDGLGMSARTTRDTQTAPTSDIRPASDSALHGHSHCSLGTLARNSAALPPCAKVITGLSQVAASVLYDGEVAYVRTILLNAPKTSPPDVVS
jgi:hypothetical protein